MASFQYDLSHIHFSGKACPRPRRPSAARPCLAAVSVPRHRSDAPLDEFIRWVLSEAGLDAAAYRPQPLNRRLPACLRLLKVQSREAALSLVKRRRELLPPLLNSLLIGVTEFFREPGVFESLGSRILPLLTRGQGQLRVWSAACSNGAELYSVAMLLAEAQALHRSYLLGTDCRGDAIAQAAAAVYDDASLRQVPLQLRDKHFERSDDRWRPKASIRDRIHWKEADLLRSVEPGPWDIIFWCNASIYLTPMATESLWRRLAVELAPGGVLVVGRAERPPKDLGLESIGRHIYRAALSHAADGTGIRTALPLAIAEIVHLEEGRFA